MVSISGCGPAQVSEALDQLRGSSAGGRIVLEECGDAHPLPERRGPRRRLEQGRVARVTQGHREGARALQGGLHQGCLGLVDGES